MALKNSAPATQLLEESPELDLGEDEGAGRRQRPPIGELIRNLRGNRTLREVERESGLPNSYLSNLENGSKRPGLKTLSRLANYFGVPLEELAQVAGLPHRKSAEGSAISALDIHRGFDFLMGDPALSQYHKPQDRLSTDTQRFIVELYQHYTGKQLL